MIQQKNVLGISLGTRAVGIAVIYDGELRDWYVKSFKGKWSEEKKELILDAIDRMLERYDIEMFAIKVPSLIERHTTVLELHRDINFLAQQKGIITNTVTIDDLKSFCGKTVTNKNGMQVAALAMFPELQHEYSRASKGLNGYYVKLFEAVLAAVYVQSLDRE